MEQENVVSTCRRRWDNKWKKEASPFNGAMSKKAQNQKPPFDAISPPPFVATGESRRRSFRLRYVEEEGLTFRSRMRRRRRRRMRRRPLGHKEKGKFPPPRPPLFLPPPYMHWLYPEALARPLVSGGFLNSLFFLPFSSVRGGAKRPPPPPASLCLPPCPREGRGRGGRKG